MFPSPQDEARHEPGPEPGWEESWQFDAAVPDASLGLSVRLGLRDGRAWWWTSVAGIGRDLVAVRDDDLAPPRGAALELRGSGLWAEVTCETPLDHWSAGLEAFGVAFDDPADAYGNERGQPMPVGLDLEWEAEGPCWPAPNGAGYGQPSAVHGDVLVGSERIELDAYGTRTHLWGPRTWWAEPWWQVHGRLDDGTAFWVANGDDGNPPDVRPADGLPRRGVLEWARTKLDLSVTAHAPVLVPGPDGRRGRLWRGLVRIAAEDGRRGAGWWEQLQAPL